jgi:glycosyltransferase involved in cell wall biosynthesis
MSLPFVTVLIDTYNHQSFIEDAINSVLRQDFPVSEAEILVVDDGSTDHTPDIIRKYAPRVQLLRKANGGQASAFNAGIPQARGEIIAFLDGDDWWAPGKLTAVTEAFAANPGVGLIGHGVTEVHPDGRQRTEMPREVSRFRITSPEKAKTFRLQRGFLGTSRMAYRKEILLCIGSVPEALKFEADEYLFTLAGLLADVMILRQAFTFYRVHGANLFQITGGDEQSIRRKQQVLSALAQSLEEKMGESGVRSEIARTILECIEVEADLLRLIVDSGFPWETISTELRILRTFHSDSSIWQHLFSYIRLIPAAMLPARTYYHWRRRLSLLAFYQGFRRKVLPFPVPSQVERREKLAP